MFATGGVVASENVAFIVSIDVLIKCIIKIMIK
jgi:hypothetical protein